MTKMHATLLHDHLNSRVLRVVTQHTGVGSDAIVTAEGPDGAIVETWIIEGTAATLQVAPADMSTPSLVREFTARKVTDAVRGGCTREQHDRHQDVVTELRRRSVLD